MQLDDSVESVYIFLPSCQTLSGLWKMDQNKDVDGVAGGVNAGITAGVALLWSGLLQAKDHWDSTFISHPYKQTSRNDLLPSVPGLTPGKRPQPKFCVQCWVQRSEGETSNVRCLKGRLLPVLPIPAGNPRADCSLGLLGLFLQL